MSVRDLRLRAIAPVAFDPPTRLAGATDAGRLVFRPPGAVCRPRDGETVRKVLAWANETRTPVTAHGLAHTHGGQGLTEGGLLLDLAGLRRVDPPGEDAVEVDGGATWRAVLRATLPRGLAPPVLTNNLDTTVAGTLSTGGVGFSSHRYGLQADNVESLDCVTGSGLSVRCSHARNRDSFDAVRCGLGQFAVITRARLRLRSVPARVTLHRAVFADPVSLLAAAAELLDDGASTHLCAWARHRSHVDRFEGLVFAPGRHWCFPLEVGVESPAGGAPRPAGLGSADGALPAVEQSTAAFAARPEPGPAAPQEADLVCPVTDAAVPWERAADALAAVLEALPSSLVPSTNVLVRPLGPLGGGGPPALVRPRAPRIVGISLVPWMRAAERDALLPAVERAGRMLVDHGGKRYLTGWIRWTADDWRAHYGPLWRRVCEWKARFDPLGVLGAPIIPFDPPVGG